MPDPQDRLRQLLALKRHEVPPPRFFDELPRRVIVSIRAGSRPADGPWWQRLWQTVVGEPMVSVSYAALGVGALVFGTSVFQLAIEPEVPDATSVEAFAFQPPTVAAPTSFSSSGVIYRVVPVEYRVIESLPGEMQRFGSPYVQGEPVLLVPLSQR